MTTSDKRYPMPFVRVELAILALGSSGLQVLQVQRAGAPFKGQWALAGGVLRIDLDDSFEEAAQRVARERLGTEVPYLRQQGVVGGRHRDPRSGWAMSVVYRALLGAPIAITPGKRVEAVRWVGVEEASVDRRLAFDHASLVAEAVEALREEVAALTLPFESLPATFSLGELQALCEAILGQRLDKSSFRRRLADRDLVEPLTGERREGAFRPAQVYRARSRATRKGNPV